MKRKTAPAHQRVERLGPADGLQDGEAIRVVRPLVGDVRTVDGEAGDHLLQGLTEGVEGEVPRSPRLLGQPIELVGQHVQLAGERDLHDQQLLAVDHLGEARTVLDQAVVKASERRGVLPVHEESVDLVQEVVAACPVDRPGLDQRLIRPEDLLDDDVERHTERALCGSRPAGSDAIAERALHVLPIQAVRVGLGLEGPAGAGHREMLLETPEVLVRVVEAVGVVDAQPVELPLRQQPEDQAVGGLEDVLTLHAEGGQVVDVEEPSIIDLVGGHPPEGQAIALVAPAGRPGGRSSAGLPGVPLKSDTFCSMNARTGSLRAAELGQPSLDHLLLATALGHLVGVGLGALGEVSDGGQDALVLVEIGGFRTQGTLQLFGPVPQDLDVTVRGDREPAVVILHGERAVGEGQPELAGLEDVSIRIAQDRQQDLVLQFRPRRRAPGDVEVGSVARGLGRPPARRSTRRFRWCRPPCDSGPCRGSGRGPARAGRRPWPRSPPGCRSPGSGSCGR